MTPFFTNTFPSKVITFVSQRPDDFSYSKDNHNFNEDQKQFFSVLLGGGCKDIVHVRQVHGDKIVKADEDYLRQRQDLDLEEADGIVTDAARIPLAIRTADCLPVFMYDTEKECIGLIHVGWRGLKKNILENLQFY